MSRQTPLLCTWCGHPDHAGPCPATVAVAATVGGRIRRFLADQTGKTGPCQCAYRR